MEDAYGPAMVGITPMARSINIAAAWRFWARARLAPSGCWEWAGASKGGRGYGRAWWAGKVVGAHRVAFFLANGYWPEPGFLVCHRCNNPICVNPEHLYKGTYSDNMRDWVYAKTGKEARARDMSERRRTAVTRLAPLDPQTEAASDDVHREALRALLVAAKGNVVAVARQLAKPGEPAQNARRRLDRRITALGLRPWLAKAYPGPGRAKVATQ